MHAVAAQHGGMGGSRRPGPAQRVALLGRLQAASGWLEAIVNALLSAAFAPPTARPERRVRLVDATMVTASDGTRWRLHSDYDVSVASGSRF